VISDLRLNIYDSDRGATYEVAFVKFVLLGMET
jgi:hypothetical protein